MSKADIYLGTSLLDFSDFLNVKRQVNDYRNFRIGSSTKSYTLNIPLTKTNRELLKYIDDLRSRQEVTDLARILVDGSEIIRGKLRLLSSNPQFAKGIVEADDWLDDISGISIRGLSWDGGDEHTFNGANVENSFTAGAGAFYRYPLINFAALYSKDVGVDAKVYPYDFYPMWNIEDIVRKIFSDVGYTLAANSFFDGAFGQALYLLSAPITVQDDFLADKLLEVFVDDDLDNYNTSTVDPANSDTWSISQVMVIGGEEEDEGDDFTGNEYTVPADGVYRFQAKITIVSEMNDAPSLWSIQANSLNWQIRKDAVALETGTGAGVILFDGEPEFTLDTGHILLEAGDVIDINLALSVDATNIDAGSQSAALYIKAGADVSYLRSQPDQWNLWPGIGTAIGPDVYLPDISSTDFLKGLKEAFNLRFWMDRANRTIYIETSDDFYGPTVVDFSDKIDYSEEISMEVIASNYFKTQRFRWKPDTSDKAYTNYVADFGVPFQKELVLLSEYTKAGATERVNPVFSPSILGNLFQVGHTDGKVSRIFGSQDFISSAEPYPAFRSKTWLPRILEWKGLVNLTTGNFDYFETIEQGSSPTAYTTFPSAETPDMSDMYEAFWLKDFNRVDKNKIATPVLKLTPAELIPFSTVVGTAANEGFRATYKVNIEGIDMYFIVQRTTTDGDRVKFELVQKM